LVMYGRRTATTASSVRVDHVTESRGVMNIHVVEHSILYGIEYCTFWFRSVVEMTRHQLLLQRERGVDKGNKAESKGQYQGKH
jgi:hypothetical protein